MATDQVMVGNVTAAQALDSCRALRGTICVCGKFKKSGRSFCMDCYIGLPADLQKGLWKRVGQGYEAAYAAAKEWLA